MAVFFPLLQNINHRKRECIEKVLKKFLKKKKVPSFSFQSLRGFMHLKYTAQHAKVSRKLKLITQKWKNEIERFSVTA